jgi:hypothetical protein
VFTQTTLRKFARAVDVKQLREDTAPVLHAQLSLRCPAWSRYPLPYRDM